jgi:hypothetical protein
LQEQYRTDVRKAIFRVLKSGKYRDKYNGYVCHFLSEMIEDPGFDQDGTRFQAIVQAAAERAFAAVYDEVSEFLHALFDEIGSGLETTPH